MQFRLMVWLLCRLCSKRFISVEHGVDDDSQLPDLKPGLRGGYVEYHQVDAVPEQQMTDPILVHDHTLDQMIPLPNQTRSSLISSGGTHDSGRKLVRSSSANIRESCLSVSTWTLRSLAP